MKPAIEIHGVGKKYAHGVTAPYRSLRDALWPPRFSRRTKKEDFWALQDIDLNIYPGDRVGIIGRNGAGKSTLLKILSRITWPTTGDVTLRGRLSGLLEVGTGFHPELTGRENIFLNGAILGLKKQEIRQRFDSMVDFSGVEKFLDTPLKNYSTGMQLRLAFAVAAHLEPEILVIDEVLAVGDAEFQQKCIGKINEVNRQMDRTVLLVSHNMSHISSVCHSAILLEEGRLVDSGNTGDVISGYLSRIEQRSAHYIWPADKRPGNDIVRLNALRVIDSAHHTRTDFRSTEQIGIEMLYEVMQEGHILWLGHNIFNQFSVNVFDTHNVQTEYYRKPHPAGRYSAIVWIPANLLNAGTYYVGSAIFNHLQKVIHVHEKDSVLFRVHDPADEMTTKGMTPGEFPGVIRPLLEWSIEKW